MAQTVKNLLAMWDTWVPSLSWEDPLEEGLAQPIPVFWPGESPWTEEPVFGVAKSRKRLRTAQHRSPGSHNRKGAQVCGLQSCPLAEVSGWSSWTVGAMEGSGQWQAHA